VINKEENMSGHIKSLILVFGMLLLSNADILSVIKGELKLVDGNKNITAYDLEKDGDSYRITVIKNNAMKEIFILNEDLIPIRTVAISLTKNNTVYSIDYMNRENGFDLLIKDGTGKQVKRLSSGIVLEPETLWFTLYDMIEGKKEFNAMVYDYMNKRILEEHYKYMGTETVITPDGKVECEMIEMGLTGFFSVFWPYKYNYYFSSKDHRFIAYKGIGAKGKEEFIYAKY
jgi:hypothetical protein